MSETSKAFSTIDEYIQLYPEDIRQKLTAMRTAIHAAVPNVQEKISWRMPTFYTTHNLAHFAVFKHHIGFYPGAAAIEAFAPRLTPYKTSKGAIQFPLTANPPLELIHQIVLYNASQNL